MSSTAHWLVLDAVASRERVLSTWETERLTRTHTVYARLLSASICTVRQKKKKKNMCACSFRRVHSGVLSPPSSRELELCCCPSADHYLPPTPVPWFVFPLPLAMSSSSCGRRSSSHFGLPKDRDRKKKISPRLHQLLPQCLSLCASSQMIFMCSAEFVTFSILQGLNAVREESKPWKSPDRSGGGKQNRPQCSLSRDQGTALSQINIRYCTREPTLEMSNVVCLN